VHREAQAAVIRLRPKSVTHVYEVGSRKTFKSVMGIRGVFHDALTYHGIDTSPGHCVDEVASGETYVPAIAPDCVLCCEVLEHAANAEQIVRQMASVLAPGGTLIVTCAGPGRAPHGAVYGKRIREGEHYSGISGTELMEWMQEAGLVKVAVETGPGNPAGRMDNRDDADVYAVGVKPA
jgi:SAM-dependent methyltransferase